jgi:uncharacterized OB-fold protein
MRIEASKCHNCEKVIVPPRKTCPYCGEKTAEMAHMTLDSQGSVLSYTILEMPPDGFDPPLILALVELEQGAVVLCHGEEIDVQSIGIGSSVEVRRVTDGRLSFTLVN